MESIFKSFPKQEELIKEFVDDNTREVNGHFHTPHSFSAFENIEQPFIMAKQEDVQILGINDFYTTDGYCEFSSLASKHKIFPLFNIEFMGLDKEAQENGIRFNDPSNPGRIYFSRKGLAFPGIMSASSHEKLSSLQEESNRQTYQMVEKLNSFLKAENINLEFDAVEVQKKLAKNLFRERHIAQAIRMAVYEKFNSDSERESFLNQIFSGKGVKSALSNIAALENEIRNNLLKTGGAAFVPEDPKAFLSFEEVRDLIIDAGGIPCYPVLLDDPNGNFTDFEENKEKFLQSLINKNVYSIELIPGRNDAKILKEFVTFFDDNNFVVTFGTEHNTPKLDPMKISCRNGVKLDDKLRQINFEGAAVIAAHQYLIAQGKEGYLSGSVAKTDQRKNFVALGKSVIEHFFNS